MQQRPLLLLPLCAQSRIHLWLLAGGARGVDGACPGIAFPPLLPPVPSSSLLLYHSCFPTLLLPRLSLLLLRCRPLFLLVLSVGL